MEASESIRNLYSEIFLIRDADLGEIRAKPMQLERSEPLIVLINSKLQFQAEAQIEFLKKVLGAVKLELNQVRVIHIPNEKWAWRDLVKHFRPQRVLVFGLSPQDLSMNVEHHHYTSLKIQNCALMFVDKLDVIMPSQSLKRTLWTALQAFFEIKS